MSKALIGATVSGTVAYFGCTLGAKLDANTASIAAGVVAVAVGGLLSMQQSDGPEEISAEQRAWEEQLKEGGGLDEPAGSDAPPPPKVPETKNLEMGHPLGGQDVKFEKNGCIDFQQFVQLLAFCHQQAAAQLIEPKKEMIKARREALKKKDDVQYQQIVLQGNQMD